MKIILFTEKESSELEKSLLDQFQNEKLLVLVDAKHKNDRDWLMTQFSCPHRFYCFDVNQNLYNVTRDELYEPPCFVIYFNQDQVVTTFDWEQIDHYMMYLIYGNLLSNRTKRHIRRIKDVYSTLEPLVKAEQPNLPQFYEFNSMVIEDRDIALFEITKANNVTPYTTIVRNFSSRGYKPLFTNYFCCNAFRNDFIAIAFLEKLWKHLMQGEMDLDEMLKEATQSCYPGDGYIPIAEPEVYQRSMQQVLEMLQMNEIGQ